MPLFGGYASQFCCTVRSSFDMSSVCITAGPAFFLRRGVLTVLFHTSQCPQSPDLFLPILVLGLPKALLVTVNSPDSRVDIPMPCVRTVAGGGAAFGSRLGHKAGARVSGISALGDTPEGASEGEVCCYWVCPKMETLTGILIGGRGDILEGKCSVTLRHSHSNRRRPHFCRE